MCTWSGSSLAGLDQLFDLGDRDPARGRHHGIEVPRRLAIHEIAPAIALPRLDQREVRRHAALQHVGSAVELARLLAFGDDRAETGRRVECRNSRAAGADALGQRSLRNEFQIDPPGQHHVFQQLVLADVAALVRLDLPGGEHQAQAEVVDADVVADGVQVLDAFFHERRDQVLRNAAQPEAADHDGRAIVDVVDRLIGVRNYLVH